jgi:hypothetical protein
MINGATVTRYPFPGYEVQSDRATIKRFACLRDSGGDALNRLTSASGPFGPNQAPTSQTGMSRSLLNLRTE